MRRTHPSPALGLSPKERRRLSYVSRCADTALYRELRKDELEIVGLRARLILAVDAAATLEEVASSMGVALATVQKWCARFLERRLEGLVESRRQRGGRPLRPTLVATILFLGESKELGSREIAKQAGVCQSTVARVLRAQAAAGRPNGIDVAALPSGGGAYVLEFQLAAPVTLVVGRLGRVTLPAGRLRYYGSAYGPGGLRARITRHLRPAGRRSHWHADALTRRVPVAELKTVLGGSECHLVQEDLAAGWVIAVSGFGCSDCRICPTHLLAQKGAS